MIRGKHNDLVEKVNQELIKRGYNDIHQFVEYRNGSCGEIDIYAKKDNYILLFECKCSKNPKSYSKAIKQLDRAERYCFRRKNRVFRFLVYNQNNEVVYERIR